LWGLIKTTTNINTAHSKNIGCEQLLAIVDTYTEAHNKIVQLLNCTCKDVSTSAVNLQNIKINFTNTKIAVKRVRFGNSSTIRLVSATSLSDNVVNEMTSEVQKAMTSTLDIIQKAASDTGAPDAAQKTVYDKQLDIRSNQGFSDIKANITRILTNVSNEQNINLQFDSTTIEGDEFIIEQNSIIELSATNMLNSALRSVFSDTSITDIINDVTVQQDKENKGLTAQVEAKGNANKLQETSWTNALIGGVILIALVFMVTMGGGLSLGTKGSQPQSMASYIVGWMCVVFGITFGIGIGFMFIPESALQTTHGERFKKARIGIVAIAGFLWILCLV
jgi:hypothetical protein